jgi:hypothetical protein
VILTVVEANLAHRWLAKAVARPAACR